jgi:hypothetical protein
MSERKLCGMNHSHGGMTPSAKNVEMKGTATRPTLHGICKQSVYRE